MKLLAGALVLGAAWAGGCSRHRSPEFAVAGASISEESPAGYVMEFVVDARNDNPDALPLLEIRYSLALDGERVFSGVRSAQATLPRFGGQQIVLPAAVALGPGRTSPEGRVRYLLSGEVSYLTPGAISQVLFDTAVRRPKVSFRKEGELDIASAPAP